MSIPSISVLLPVRDAGQTLEACLKSLARQTVSDYEVVALDDGSQDGSGEMLDRWAARDPRLRVLHLPAAGLVTALNLGLGQCRAPLVARMDADAFLGCKAHHLLRGPLLDAARLVVWGAGRTGRRLGRALLEGGAAIGAYIDIDPAKIGRTLHGAPIVAPEELPRRISSGTPVLAAVAARGARDLIRARLDALGLVEGSGYWCVA